MVCLVLNTRQPQTLGKLVVCLVCSIRQNKTLGKASLTADAAQPTV